MFGADDTVTKMRTKQWAGNVDRARPRNRNRAPGGGRAVLFLRPRGAARSPSRSCRDSDRRPFKGLSRPHRAAGSDPALHAHHQAAVARSASAPPAGRPQSSERLCMSDAGLPAIRPSVWNAGGAVMRWEGRLPRARPEPRPALQHVQLAGRNYGPVPPARAAASGASGRAPCTAAGRARVEDSAINAGPGRQKDRGGGPRGASRWASTGLVIIHPKAKKGWGMGGHCSAAGPWDEGHLAHASHGAARGVRGRQRLSLRRGRAAKGASEMWDGTP